MFNSEPSAAQSHAAVPPCVIAPYLYLHWSEMILLHRCWAAPAWTDPLSKGAATSSAHLARAPSGSARLMCACGPRSESRWAETSCCLSWAACWARTTGVSRSSALLSFAAVWKRVTAGEDHTATAKHGLVKFCKQQIRTTTQLSTHLDGIDFLSELLDFIHQTLVLLLRCLFHSAPVSKLAGVQGNCMNSTHIWTVPSHWSECTYNLIVSRLVANPSAPTDAVWEVWK